LNEKCGVAFLEKVGRNSVWQAPRTKTLWLPHANYSKKITQSS